MPLPRQQKQKHKVAPPPPPPPPPDPPSPRPPPPPQPNSERRRPATMQAAFSSLDNLLYQNAARKLPFVVRLYFTQGLSVVRACRALIQLCATSSERGRGRYIESLREIVDLTGEVVLSASHLFVSASSGERAESVDDAFENISQRISVFVRYLLSLESPATLQRIQLEMTLQDLESFGEYIEESKRQDKRSGNIVCRMRLAATKQLAKSRRQRFLEKYNNFHWSSI